ncbi:MAG: hypothetical protein H0U59_00095 [Gemmatimonadaceae bacterium]|nr:hypothetical protein [Gemmatimonadaceae bacterium]
MPDEAEDSKLRRLRGDVLATGDAELCGDAAIRFSRSICEARVQIREITAEIFVTVPPIGAPRALL